MSETQDDPAEDPYELVETQDDGFSRQDAIEAIRRYFREIDTEGLEYVQNVVLPAIILSILGLSVAAFVPIPGFSFSNQLIGILSVFVLFLSLVYPYIIREQKSKQVTENFHLFITQMTALSVSNVNRMEVLQQLATEDQYGYLAEEVRRVTVFVDTWNQSLDEAALVLSNRTASDILSNFLERMSHNISSGQGLDEFLVEEQDAIIRQYVTRYRADLDRLEVFSDTYLSFMLSLSFALIFASIAPLLTGTRPILLLGPVVALFVTMQVAFVIIIHTTAPEDFLMYQGEGGTELSRQMRRTTAVSIVVTLGLSAVLAAIGAGLVEPLSLPTVIPRPLYISIAGTPCIIGGYRIKQIESLVKSRDKQYAGFIRGVGSTEAVRQSSTASVLQDLRQKDFGDLSKQINGLYKRLNSRIDQRQAWRYFSAESGSYLIWKFSKMYLIGRSFGANTKELAQIISHNFNEIMQLRERREQVVSTLIGLLYGLISASAFAFYSSVEVIKALLQLSETISTDKLVGSVISVDVYNVATLNLFITVTIVSTAVASAIIIRVANRKKIQGAIFHFGLLLWVGMIGATAAKIGGQFIAL